MGGLPRGGEMAWPGFVSAWAWLPPHQHETVTGAHQIGVAFSGHRDVHLRSGSRARRASYPGGSVICSGSEPILWSDVRDPTEALEIYPTSDLISSVLQDDRGNGWPVDRLVVGVADPVVVGIARMIRRAHVSPAYLSETKSSSLGHLLVRHVLQEYGGLRLPPAPGHTRLTHSQVGQVADLVAADLAGSLTLDRLAGVTHLSPHHFARAFKATVGQAPYAFVTAHRMQQARHLLGRGDLTVESVARKVGFTNLSHFRRVFRAHSGAGPAAYRRAARS
jgi:AraC family transcriptional regulator